MRKLFFVEVMCARLIFSTGFAGEEKCITIDPIQNITTGELLYISGTTNLEEGTELEIGIDDPHYHRNDNPPLVRETAVVQSGQNGSNICNITTKGIGFRGGYYEVTVSGKNISAMGSTNVRYPDPDPRSPEELWIALDPISRINVSSNLTITGTTNLNDDVLLVEVMRNAHTHDLTGTSIIIRVQKEDDGVNTWEVTINTTGWTVDEYSVCVTGIANYVVAANYDVQIFFLLITQQRKETQKTNQ